MIKNAAQVLTISGHRPRKGKDMNDLGIIRDGAVLVVDGMIKEVGKSELLSSKVNESAFSIIDARGKVVMPGFVDPHTHFVFGGYRAEEYTWRLKGESYLEIMEKGGGILKTVQDTRRADPQELIESGKKRLDRMIRFGVTTVEGKSGYGLDLETEIKQLEVMKSLDAQHPVDIKSTFLGAHAVPMEFCGKADQFLDYLISEVMPEVRNRNLADFCDIFCEANVFSIQQSRRYLTEAKKLGFKIKLHADEIAPLGGAELAAELGAISADHLLRASHEGIKAMAQKSVIATLLPGTAFSLKAEKVRRRKMIDRGCAVALATDFNPGSCFTQSIPLILALATIQTGLTTEEAITGLTLNSAAAIGCEDRLGSLDPGKQADILILEFPSYQFLSYYLGINIVEKVIKKGKLVIDNTRGEN